MKTEINTYTRVLLITSMLGGRPNSYDCVSFDTIEDAKSYWVYNYAYRNKKDGYDDYWRKIPFITQIKTTTTITQQHTIDEVAEIKESA